MRNPLLVWFLLPAWLVGSAASAQPVAVSGPRPQAPPPALPVQRLPASPGAPPQPLGATPYSIGQPTDQEQLYLEYLNRMRANPTAEGQRLASTTDPSVLAVYASFNVDLNLLQAEFATNPPVPPLALNAELINAARWHSGDMFTNQYQGHYQTNGTTVLSPGDRIAAMGYNATAYGENVYAYADSVFYGHAGFAVDWGGPGGGTIGGMQNPPGHRDNMLSPLYREVGVGVVDGSNGTVGPQLVTQDFGVQPSSPAFITGVVYFDLNGSGFYDLGEGIGGVTVNTPGSTYFAVTADSGGYAIPVTANGNYTLTFTGPGLSNQTVVAISGMQNAKVDYSPAYSPPTISGPNPAGLNQNNTYTISPVAGATGYQWLAGVLGSYTLVEGAENGLGNVTAVTSSGYSVISTDYAASGTHSFHLEHVSPVDQSITLNASLLLSAGSQLTFAEMLTYAFSNEVAEAQVSTDGKTWQTVWTEAGNDGSSSVDSAFVTQSVSLGAYAGEPVQIRFVYGYNSGYYFNTGMVGLYVDNIGVSNARQLSSATTNTVNSGNSFTFSPAAQTNYLLAARAQINSRLLPWGPAFPLSVATAVSPPTIQLLTAPTISGTQVQLDFTVNNYRSGMAFQVYQSNTLPGIWVKNAGATLQTIVPNSHFRFTISTGGAPSLFFQIRGG